MPRKAQAKTNAATSAPVLNPHAAGIDIGAGEARGVDQEGSFALAQAAEEQIEAGIIDLLAGDGVLLPRHDHRLAHQR